MALQVLRAPSLRVWQPSSPATLGPELPDITRNTSHPAAQCGAPPGNGCSREMSDTSAPAPRSLAAGTRDASFIAPGALCRGRECCCDKMHSQDPAVPVNQAVAQPLAYACYKRPAGNRMLFSGIGHVHSQSHIMQATAERCWVRRAVQQCLASWQLGALMREPLARCTRDPRWRCQTTKTRRRTRPEKERPVH